VLNIGVFLDREIGAHFCFHVILYQSTSSARPYEARPYAILRHPLGRSDGNQKDEKHQATDNGLRMLGEPSECITRETSLPSAQQELQRLAQISNGLLFLIYLIL